MAPALKEHVHILLQYIEDGTDLKRSANWAHSLTVKKLGESPLWQGGVAVEDVSGICIQTVHQAKGKGIVAVLYVATKRDIDNLLKGPVTEEGRIGYVAITRARDLLILAFPDTIPEATTASLKGKGFVVWE